MDGQSVVDRSMAVRMSVLLIIATLAASVRSAPITIVNHGPASNRVDMLFLGDGYTQANHNAGLFDTHIQSYLTYIFSGGFLADPFPRYQKFFNVHKVNVVSAQSGADVPSQSIFRNTALDASYEIGGPQALTVDEGKADTVRNQALAGSGITADIQMVAVNDSRYGGATANWAVYAAATPSAQDLALHEMGHQFSQLVDEYVAIAGAYAGPEPPYKNITTNASGKWGPWIGYADSRSSNLDIGAHEGALYATGLYRPAFDSKMRNLYRPFDAVSREAFIHDIYEHVDPLDAWRSNSQTVIDDALWVDVVDPNVIALQWFVDDVLVPGATGEQFQAREFGFGPGNYDIRVRAYDEVVEHSFSGDSLDLVRRDLSLLEQSVSWSLTITPSMLGDYNGDEIVDSPDYSLFRKTYGSNQYLAADGNNTGAVNAADYVVWRKFFDSAGGSSGNTSIPEPATLTVCLAALFMGATFRRADAAVRH